MVALPAAAVHGNTWGASTELSCVWSARPRPGFPATEHTRCQSWPACHRGALAPGAAVVLRSSRPSTHSSPVGAFAPQHRPWSLVLDHPKAKRPDSLQTFAV